jgi:hypothetical protein
MFRAANKQTLLACILEYILYKIDEDIPSQSLFFSSHLLLKRRLCELTTERATPKKSKAAQNAKQNRMQLKKTLTQTNWTL